MSALNGAKDSPDLHKNVNENENHQYFFKYLLSGVSLST